MSTMSEISDFSQNYFGRELKHINSKFPSCFIILSVVYMGLAFLNFHAVLSNHNPILLGLSLLSFILNIFISRHFMSKAVEEEISKTSMLKRILRLQREK